MPNKNELFGKIADEARVFKKGVESGDAGKAIRRGISITAHALTTTIRDTAERIPIPSISVTFSPARSIKEKTVDTEIWQKGINLLDRAVGSHESVVSISPECPPSYEEGSKVDKVV